LVEIGKELVAKSMINLADVLNIALFGITAMDWRNNNPNKKGNMRDYCDVTQLVWLDWKV